MNTIRSDGSPGRARAPSRATGDARPRASRRDPDAERRAVRVEAIHARGDRGHRRPRRLGPEVVAVVFAGHQRNAAWQRVAAAHDAPSKGVHDVGRTQARLELRGEARVAVPLQIQV